MHLFDSLQSAANIVVKQVGYRVDEIQVERWAITYRCSADDVRQALKIAENGSRKLPEEIAATTPPPIQPEEIDE